MNKNKAMEPTAKTDPNLASVSPVSVIANTIPGTKTRTVMTVRPKWMGAIFEDAALGVRA